MASNKKPNGNGRATIRDVLEAVGGLHKRIDDTHKRIDGTRDAQNGFAEQMSELHTAMTHLRATTNERLHEMEADITTMRRPWVFLANGWTKALTAASVAAAVSGTVVRLELWRFLPF